MRQIILAVLLALAGTAHAGILYVDTHADGSGGGRSWGAACSTIQAAVNAAGPSDEIWVAAGVYEERVVFPVKHGPMVYGGFTGSEARRDRRDPKANETVIDAGHKGSAVVGRTMMGLLDGFTLRNGTGTPVPAADVLPSGDRSAPMVLCGGGAYITGKLTLRNCIVEDCTADVGGGVALHGGNGLSVENCIIRDNRAERGGGLALFGTDAGYAVASSAFGCRLENNHATLGGGVYVSRYVLNLDGCTLDGNRATRGGGLLLDNANASVSANTFRRNVADSGAGASVEMHSGGSLTSNLFTENRAAAEGGGVTFRDEAKTALRNNTFTGNTAKRGGAVFIASPAGPLVLNNIFARNTSGIAYAPVLPRPGYNSAAPSVRTNVFYLNGKSDEEGLGDVVGQAGNRAIDPMLAEDGIHLRPGSPCLDAADGEGRPVPGRDIDGQPRLSGLGLDIGADEWRPF